VFDRGEDFGTKRRAMSSQVKMALIIGESILLAVSLWIYFSPYQTCVRAWTQQRWTGWINNGGNPNDDMYDRYKREAQQKCINSE
jgi:hypothetical protein